MKDDMNVVTGPISEISMETPAERRRRRVRDAIISAAERVFAKEGPEGLSIRRLADEIDYSPSAIYKYFSSKTELVAVLQEAFFEGLVANIEKVKSRPDIDLSECARESVATYVRTALGRPHHYAAAFSDIGDDADHRDFDAYMRDNQGTFRFKAFEMLSELVSECVEAGLFRKNLNVGPASKSLWASMHGLAMLMIHIPNYGTSFPCGETMERNDFILFHSDLVIRGLEA
jgi:AcrR family transcriptional regulator